MCEESSVVEEKLQQEDILPKEDVVEELPQQNDTLPEEEAVEELPQQNDTLPEEEAVEELPQENSNEESSAPEKDSENDPIIAEESKPSHEPKVLPYHERYYLKYRQGKRTQPLDIDGTKALLKEMGFDGGELRQAREGRGISETFRNSDQNNTQMHCSYCGAAIAGVEFYRLPDGRMRCTTCSSTVIQNKAELEELCKRVISNMENFFGASIDVSVSIEVVDERKLKKKIGIPLGTQDAQSMLILGVAINKRKQYSIILENGAPRISLIATFAHELTHIWQYIHWDNNKNFKKCPHSKRLLVYEGMAKWAEIQYLYMIGETTVARREEFITRNRQDEYGIGFCLYESQYPLSREAMSCECTPFTPDRYPLD